MAIEKLNVVTVRMTPVLHRQIRNAAEASGLGFADWIRAVLARAANEGAFTPKKGGRGDERSNARR
jgi:hypothetical protein